MGGATGTSAGFDAEVELTPSIGCFRGDFVAHPNLTVAVHVDRGLVAGQGPDGDLAERASDTGNDLEAGDVVEQELVSSVVVHTPVDHVLGTQRCLTNHERLLVELGARMFARSAFVRPAVVR